MRATSFRWCPELPAPLAFEGTAALGSARNSQPNLVIDLLTCGVYHNHHHRWDTADPGWRGRDPRRTLWLSLALLVTIAATGRSNRAEEVRLAIGGYDPVAYFTDNKAVPGRAEHELVWDGARWRFATAAHRDLFARDPRALCPAI